MPERWPDLPYDSWQDTCETLHRFSQLVGKIALRRLPLTNHFWSSSLLPSARGLHTRPIPGDDGTTFDLELDLVSHQLIIRTSEGAVRTVGLGGCTVASFCQDTLGELERLGLGVAINDHPMEIPSDPTPLLEDYRHGTYDPDKAHDWLRIVLSTTDVMRHFRASFVGKCSPIQLWWGGFDLAVTRFSGRPAPPRRGFVEHEAYSHECASVGMWPGAAGMGGPYFYAYTAPAPAGLEQAVVKPPQAAWSKELAEHLLAYDVVRTARDPEGTLLSFFQSTYEAGATLAGWDRASLERPEPRLPPLPAQTHGPSATV